MDTRFDSALEADLSIDAEQRVRHILHDKTPHVSAHNNPRTAATDYLRERAQVLSLAAPALAHLEQRTDFLNPRDEGVSFRLDEEKRFFDSVTYGFCQTCLNVPVWEGGLAVTIKQNPTRIVAAANTSRYSVRAKLPPRDAIERYRELFAAAARQAAQRDAGEAEAFIEQLLRIEPAAPQPKANARGKSDAPFRVLRFNRGRFFVYRYDPRQRQPTPYEQRGEIEKHDMHPTLPLPPLHERLREGQDYLVAELLFTATSSPWGVLNWRALVEVESGAVLYLRALIDGVNGLVFTADPITSTGVLTNTADQNNALLDPLRDDVVLPRLNAPVAGIQSLVGSYVQLIDDDTPNIAPPTQPTGTDFDYQTRTDEFAAVNAYYHADSIFALIEDLGFPLATYFDGTSFPVHVDHRASTGAGNGIEINAFCAGDAEGNGIGLAGYCLNDTTDVANPIGRAVDKWVHWHEIGGHGILWDHVDSPNFGFAHSAGDGLAALQNDPESQLRALPERFRYAPFRAGLDRWFNRDVASGWGWDGSQDTGGYNSEQILATCHFRFYCSLGGDAAEVPKRWHASRVASYLVLRTVSTLTPATNPPNALAYCNALMAADLLDWTTEGLFGGAYNKVIRWAFEQQGLFQPPGAPTPVTTIGAPPDVDLYIDDGRGGEYPYQPVHWQNESIWNRHAPDGGTTHQHPIEGAANYAYVKIRNRGTLDARKVVVKGYHSAAGAGLVWPGDFSAMSPAAGVGVASVAANDGEEVTVGPFKWQPHCGSCGDDCVLMIVASKEDPSNVQHFIAGDTIAEWRLVPHDNNTGLRNIALVAAGCGKQTLLDSLRCRCFFVRNASRRRAGIELQVELPELLRERGWKISFRDLANGRFELGAGDKRKVCLEVEPGKDIAPQEVKAAKQRDIIVRVLADGMVIGGMTYRLDPALKRSPCKPQDDDCHDQARKLLECLDLPHDVKDVCVRKISIDFELNCAVDPRRDHCEDDCDRPCGGDCKGRCDEKDDKQRDDGHER